MGTNKKHIAESRKKLSRLQGQHAALAKVIEHARLKLEKRARRLQDLEMKISKTERRAFKLSHANGQPSDGPVQGLRRAYLIFNPTSGPDGKEGRSPEPLVA